VSSRLHVLPPIWIFICHVVIILEPGGWWSWNFMFFKYHATLAHYSVVVFNFLLLLISTAGVTYVFGAPEAMQNFKYFRELLVSSSSPANRCSVCNSRSGEEIPRMCFPCQPGVPEVCRGLLRPSRQITDWYINSCHIVNYQVSYHSTLWRISLMKQQFVITYTILHSDISLLLDRWVTNTRSLKTLCPSQIFFFYLIFSWKRNMINL